MAHFLTEAALYICSSREWSADTKSADELEVCDVVLVARARLQVTFHEIAWTIDRWRCSRCQRCARNKLTLAALKTTAFVPLYGAARGDAPFIPRVHLSHRIRSSGPITWCTICGAYSSNRSFALRQCCPGPCPCDTRSQRLRQLVIGRHPDYWSLAGWMMQLSPCREFLLEHRCSCVGIDISRSMKESNHHHRCFKFSPQVLVLVCTVAFRE